MATAGEPTVTITLPQRVWQVVEDELMGAYEAGASAPPFDAPSDDHLTALLEAIGALKGVDPTELI